ncbi:MAG: cytochrome c biogenesis protein ResB, partial [Deltaproteobacteria bacterium]|nr:cytochrome c biogenesis protein ResB [Deltaproteobacteria bacterium]
DIELLEYLPSAVPSQDLFVKAITQATVQAARIAVVNRSTGQRYEGWISTGEQLMPPKPLRLEDKLMLAMTRPEPRRFVSQVKVFTQEGQEVESAIEVNKPLKAGSWLIYQRDYDTQAGRSSTWSGFELVRDPWLGLANAGLIVWAAGSLGLIAKGRKGR